MSTATLPHSVTVEEFLLRPLRTDGFQEELIEGEIYLSPNTKPIHSDIAARLFRRLLPLEQKGFTVLGQVACRLSDVSLPNTDVCVFRKEIWETAVATNEYPRQSPALVIEVHSPTNRKLQRKAALYLEGDAEQVWIVYPKEQKVLVLDQEGTREARTGESIEFSGLVISVSEIFPGVTHEQY